MDQLFKLNPLAFSLVIPALITLCIAVYAFTRRSVIGARSVGFLMLALYIWSLFYGAELSCLTIEGMMLCNIFEYLGIAVSPVLLLILALQYTAQGKLVNPFSTVLLLVIPVITITLVATNPLHHLYYTSVSVDSSGPFPMLDLTRGPWFWVHTAYSYGLIITSVVILLIRMGKPGSVFYSQSVAMLIGLMVPLIANLVYIIFNWKPIGHLDMTPFAFSATGVVIAWSIFRHGLFDIMPTAHDVIIDDLDDVIVVLDRQNRIVEFNKAARKVLGMSQLDVGQPTTVVWKEWPGLVELVESGRTDRIEIVLHTRDTVNHYEAFTYKISGLPENALRKVVSLHDISGMKQVEWALRRSEEKFRLLVEHSHDIIYTMTPDGVMTFVSPAWTTLLGHQVNQVIGQPFVKYIHPEDAARSMEALAKGLQTGEKVIDFEYRVFHIDGTWRWHTTSAVALRDEAGTIIGIEGISRDISERKMMEQKLEEMATHDFLTGLPNRVLLQDRFRIAAALAHRNKGRLAVMSLDLDEFKPVNDRYGHEVGDLVLKTVSTRLAGIIRASDTLARIGGDEFILLMAEIKGVDDATAVATKILDLFAEPLTASGYQFNLSTSIGIAIYPEDGCDLETLTRKSDAAMYYSKTHGRNQFNLYSNCQIPE